MKEKKDTMQAQPPQETDPKIFETGGKLQVKRQVYCFCVEVGKSVH
jgi:hypothetical protein